jgi:hypothetical protein
MRPHFSLGYVRNLSFILLSRLINLQFSQHLFSSEFRQHYVEIRLYHDVPDILTPAGSTLLRTAL